LTEPPFSDVPSDKRPGASQRRLAEQGASPRELRRWAVVRAGVARFHYGIATDIAEALSLAGGLDGPIQLLLTDVVMPGMSGGELARRLGRAVPR